jgi:hypothetical protein
MFASDMSSTAPYTPSSTPSKVSALHNGIHRVLPFTILRFSFTLLAVCSLCPQRALAQPELVKSEMQSLYEPLRELLPYLADQDRFSDNRNKSVIAKNLDTLRNGFHTVEAIPSRYQKMPGFTFAVVQLREILDDATSRFTQGKPEYAWWRSRVVPGACFACHATYNVKSVYNSQDIIDSSLPLMEQARFNLATRQFAEAEKALLKVLATPEQRINFGEALKSLLTVELRVYDDPPHTVQTLRQIQSSAKLPEDDLEELQRWIKTLSSQKKRIIPDQELIKEGERLISAGLPTRMDDFHDTPLLLMGTTLLQRGLERSNPISDEERRKALLLLGSAYTQLPLYFAESWASLYLEQCINEFPGSREAKQAFKAYKEALVDQFTGSSGTNFPAEVTEKLDNLRKKAYAIPDFKSRL